MCKVSGSKVTSQQGVTFLLQGDAEKCEKTPLFVKRSVTKNFQREIFLGRRLSEPPHTQLGLTSNWFDQKNYKRRGIPRYFETDQDPNRPCRACVHSLGNLLKLFDRQGLDCYACLVTAFSLEFGSRQAASIQQGRYIFSIIFYILMSDQIKKYFSLTINMTINSFQVHTPFRQAHRGKSCEIYPFI